MVDLSRDALDGGLDYVSAMAGDNWSGAGLFCLPAQILMAQASQRGRWGV
jgi:hypothetical protein